MSPARSRVSWRGGFRCPHDPFPRLERAAAPGCNSWREGDASVMGPRAPGSSARVVRTESLHTYDRLLSSSGLFGVGGDLMSQRSRRRPTVMLPQAIILSTTDYWCKKCRSSQSGYKGQRDQSALIVRSSFYAADPGSHPDPHLVSDSRPSDPAWSRGRTRIIGTTNESLKHQNQQ